MTMGVNIIGVGRTKTEEKWVLGLVDLAVKAAGDALKDAGSKIPEAIVVGNALGGALEDQQNLATYVASRLGLQNIETHSVCCDEASGGNAIRVALSLINAGFHDSVLVIGAEKTSDTLPDKLEAVCANGLDSVREAGFGFGPAVASGLGMQRYISQHKIKKDLFFYLSQTAHYHAAKNPLAFFAWELSFEQYKRAQVVADPLTVCDLAPICDGSAAVFLQKKSQGTSDIKIIGSSSVCYNTGIIEPIEKLALPSATQSAKQALTQARLTIEDLSFLELHDSSSLISALSIESVGLAKRGEALYCAKNGDFMAEGRAPLWSFGGLKARGNAPGASGVLQVVESVLQLRGDAQKNQIPKATTALVQCLGSFGAQAVTHVLG